MEFKNDELIEREIEIAVLLIQHFSIKQIAETTGLSIRHLNAHIKNMLQKVKADDLKSLIALLKTKFDHH